MSHSPFIMSVCYGKDAALTPPRSDTWKRIHFNSINVGSECVFSLISINHFPAKDATGKKAKSLCESYHEYDL